MRLDETPQPDRSDFYRDYSALKQWVGEYVPDDMDRFSRALKKIRLPNDSSILEIGFGEGRFLDWAREHGHTVEGIEILPDMVKRARLRNHVVYLGALHQLEAAGPRFDLIAAFDVVEHLTIAEILDLFEDADHLLKRDGKILLQFPNSSSPFSALYQNGDLTHKSALSKASLEQISRSMGWYVDQFFNARATSRHPLKQIKMWVSHAIRDLLELVFGYIYYGVRVPLDPNIVVVFNRSKANDLSAPVSFTAPSAG